jgi:hypothetical protein
MVLLIPKDSKVYYDKRSGMMIIIMLINDEDDVRSHGSVPE